MINNYLKTLLADNKRVIIPDFGGFVVKRSAAGDIISFNSFLKFNDDLLVSLIAAEEGVDKTQALKQIKDAVVAINTSLDTEGKYTIEEVGFLIKDKKGNIRFVDDVDDVAASVPPPVEQPKQTSETQQVLDKETAKEEMMDTVQVEEVSADEEVVTKQKKGGLLWIVLIVIFIAIGAWAISHYAFNKVGATSGIELAEGTDHNDGVGDQLSDKHSKLIEKMADDQMQEKAVSADKSFKEKVIAFFKGLFSKKEKATAPSVIDTAEVVIASVMAANQVDTISGILVVADKLISPKGKERYNVIIGSFTESENAKKYNQELIEDGYASGIFDRYNGFDAVSMGSYPSLDIALKVCGEALSQTPDVWVLVK